jgi:hypothetical protein
MNSRSMKIIFRSILILTCCLQHLQSNSQTITGVWRGKVKGSLAEIKIIKSGDNLVGVAYYYQNKNRFKRYSIKGHFDPETNSVIWWDELLLNEQSGNKFLQIGPDAEAQMMVADFNCPGTDEMFLDGTSSSRDNKSRKNGTVHLQKMESPVFSDEWDYIIDNYFVGTNDPQLIDSISQYGIAAKIPEEPTIPDQQPVEPAPAATDLASTPPAIISNPVAVPTTAPITAPATIGFAGSAETKFSSRKNVLQTVIPITANKIELRFYDNAQVDGDSIALFLNGKLLLKNIRLTEQPYTVFLDTKDLAADNELVMVAENLGSIPPNTSFMVAIVGDKRYEARLFANEKSSALIRIVQPKPGEQ